MAPFREHRWFLAAAGITLAFSAVSLVAHPSLALTAFADLTGLLLMLAALGITLTNAGRRPGQERSFWALMALGFSCWVTNQAAWTVWETVLHRQIPDPFVFDIVLFFHAVPMFAAVGWRPDLQNKEGKVLLSLLNFLMLLGWWIFLRDSGDSCFHERRALAPSLLPLLGGFLRLCGEFPVARSCRRRWFVLFGKPL